MVAAELFQRMKTFWIVGPIRHQFQEISYDARIGHEIFFSKLNVDMEQGSVFGFSRIDDGDSLVTLISETHAKVSFLVPSLI